MESQTVDPGEFRDGQRIDFGHGREFCSELDRKVDASAGPDPPVGGLREQTSGQPCPGSTPCTSIHSVRKSKRVTWQRRSAARAARPSGGRNRSADLLLRARSGTARTYHRRRR